MIKIIIFIISTLFVIKLKTISIKLLAVSISKYYKLKYYIILGGVWSNSLAIATDAAHLLTDLTSFMISLFSIWMSNKPATKKMPFGWYRIEVHNTYLHYKNKILEAQTYLFLFSRYIKMFYLIEVVSL